MVFSDLLFLYIFLPCFVLFYIAGSLIDKASQGKDRPRDQRPTTMRNVVLIVFSLFFYAWGEPVYVFLMIGNVTVNYFVGRWIGSQEGAARKWALATGLTLDILSLGVFKYAGFFAQTLVDVGLPVSVPQISLPIGISFYTFQAMSYLIDVYRKEAPAQKKFYNLLLYISMFPQLVAGPIVRYDSVQQEIAHREVKASDLTDGIFRFVIGLGKKVILANQLGEIADQFLKNGITDLTTSGAWVGIIAFALQIYYDFSGYSDMAIGMGRCMGFHFKENFNHPYTCSSITDFWRRWHMTLGGFFRDYVYIPLGGNRRHQALNIFVVWFLTGFWHGASWNFIFWGLYFGFFVMIEKYTILKLKHIAWRPLLHLYSLVVVVVGWGLFYFDSLTPMCHFYNVLIGNGSSDSIMAETALTNNFFLWIAALAFILPLRQWADRLNKRIFKDNTTGKTFELITRMVVTVAILLLSTALLVGATNNAFIYTRF